MVGEERKRQSSASLTPESARQKRLPADGRCHQRSRSQCICRANDCLFPSFAPTSSSTALAPPTMPLFHDPHHGPEEKLKIELKRWERSFCKMNGRKPGKEDIEAAGEDVSLMYKRYWSVIKGHPLEAKSQKCKSRTDRRSDSGSTVAAGVPQKENQGGESSSSHVASSLPTGVWGDNLLKKNFNPRPDQEPDESPTLQPFLSQLRKLHLREDYVKTNMVKGLFSLKRRKKPIAEPPAELPLDSDDFDLQSEMGHFSDTSAPATTELSTPVVASPASIILNNIYSDISPSSGISSFSGSSLKENDCSNQSFARPPSSNCPSIKLFDEDEDNSTESEIAKVKETVAEALHEVNFDGCELLPIDFKMKKSKSKNPPTAKALKKRNDNYLKINMKKKSYASRGYKKIDVAKEKRKAHYRAKRDRCFTCGESGHWRHECPLLNKPAGKATPVTETATDAASEPDPNDMNFCADHNDIPFLPEDHVIMTDTEEAI